MLVAFVFLVGSAVLVTFVLLFGSEIHSEVVSFAYWAEEMHEQVLLVSCGGRHAGMYVACMMP